MLLDIVDSRLLYFWWCQTVGIHAPVRHLFVLRCSLYLHLFQVRRVTIHLNRSSRVTKHHLFRAIRINQDKGSKLVEVGLIDEPSPFHLDGIEFRESCIRTVDIKLCLVHVLQLTFHTETSLVSTTRTKAKR